MKKDEPSTSRLMNMNVKTSSAENRPQGSSIYPEYSNMSAGGKGPLDTDLNLLLRRRMSILIGK
jgi:hypothetical protein